MMAKENTKKEKPLILLTNDDGINAKGINILFNHISKIADVVVVAPDVEKSATSNSLSLVEPVRIFSIKKDFYAVTGFPD